MTLPDFSGLRVHVIGDAIRDVYTEARALGMASKSPTLVYETLGSQEWIGGSGVVAEHCRAAGAQVTLTTAGETIKERIVVEGVKVAEFHSSPPDPTPLADPQALDVDVVIFADFGHGVFTPTTLPIFQASIFHVPTVAADSQTTDICWGNILDFVGADLLFANEREARFALGDQHSSREAIGDMLWEEAEDMQASAVFFKWGAQGCAIYSSDPPILIPAYAKQPIVDPIGAGDALLVYATLTYAVTKDLQLAGEIGSLAAAEACAHLGNVPVTREAVERRGRWGGA